jgi:hypothetical protein
MTKHIAENSSEIFMTWKGKKTSGIGEHAYKLAEQSHI